MASRARSASSRSIAARSGGRAELWWPSHAVWTRLGPRSTRRTWSRQRLTVILKSQTRAASGSRKRFRLRHALRKASCVRSSAKCRSRVNRSAKRQTPRTCCSSRALTAVDRLGNRGYSGRVARLTARHAPHSTQTDDRTASWSSSFFGRRGPGGATLRAEASIWRGGSVHRSVGLPISGTIRSTQKKPTRSASERN